MKIKRVLVSQHKPSDYKKSPYYELSRKFNIEFDFRKFIEIKGLSASEFRKFRIPLEKHSAVILTSRLAVDHYFRLAKQMRYDVPDDTKYFCLSESTALYLQKYIQYRKRKIFSDQDFVKLVDIMRKHNSEEYLFACSSVHKPAYPHILEQNGIKYQKAVMYRTVPTDMKQLNIRQYDMLVFFSPVGVQSLLKNFPDFEQKDTHIACYGAATSKAVKDHGLTLNLCAPTKTAPSMTMALEEYFQNHKHTHKR